MNFVKFLPRVLRVQRYHYRKICSENLDEDSLDLKYQAALEVYEKSLRISNVRARELLKAHPVLVLDKNGLRDTQATVQFLNLNGITTAEILKRPRSLLINQITISNRLKVLEECCFKDIDLMYLYKFITLMNKKVCMIQAHSYIDPQKDLIENLVSYFDVHVVLQEKMNDQKSLLQVRESVMNDYLRVKYNMSNHELAKYWKVYPRLKHRSFRNVVEVTKILDRLSFSREKTINNGFLLYACPTNFNRLLIEVPQIGDEPIESLILKRPKIAMQNVETIKEIIKHLKNFEVPEKYLLKCLDLLTLSSDSVYERLVSITKIKEFNVLKSNPRVLRLIHFQNKAVTRLDYLKQLKVKCASLNILSSSSDTFEKYARDGVDRTKGKDAVYYIARVLKMDKDVVRDTFSRHPNWCNVPLISIKNVLDYLKYKKFSEPDIKQNIHLLLYPISRIEQKLTALLDWKSESDENRMISGVALSAISNSKMLNLCLYFIEQEFHFSGDGIWDVNRTDMKQDLFPTTIPDFPKTLTKHYRFGGNSKKSGVLKV